MTSHKDKGILKIDYNYLNIPDKLKFDQTYIYRNTFTGTNETRNVMTKYLYRADGTKLSKDYTYGVSRNQSERSSITEYLDGFQYEGAGIPTSIINRSLKFVPTSEGYFNFVINKYIYNYTDHLGNIRLHPGTWSPDQISGPLNPSGFRMSQFPFKANGYTSKVLSKKNSGDRVSAETMPNAVNFIYAPAHNTTIIYNSTQIIKAYEGKFKKD